MPELLNTLRKMINPYVPDKHPKKVVKKKSKKKRNGKSKKKVEFMKIAVGLTFVLAFFAVVDSYVLSHMGYDPNAEVTSEVVRTLLGSIVIYGVKSWGEKSSRNKYNVSVEGEDFPVIQDESVTLEDIASNIGRDAVEEESFETAEG